MLTLLAHQLITRGLILSPRVVGWKSSIGLSGNIEMYKKDCLLNAEGGFEARTMNAQTGEQRGSSSFTRQHERGLKGRKERKGRSIGLSQWLQLFDIHETGQNEFKVEGKRNTAVKHHVQSLDNGRRRKDDGVVKRFREIPR